MSRLSHVIIAVREKGSVRQRSISWYYEDIVA
jgi:hypothetical protein